MLDTTVNAQTRFQVRGTGYLIWSIWESAVSEGDGGNRDFSVEAGLQLMSRVSSK